MKLPDPQQVAQRFRRTRIARQDPALYNTATGVFNQMALVLRRRPDLLVSNLAGIGTGKELFLAGYYIGHPDLLIVFDPYRKHTGIAKQNGKMILRLGTRVIPQGADSAQEILTALVRKKKTVIHELTHYVDALRTGEGWDKATQSYPPDEDSDQSRTEYVNHPLELNAQFLEALTPLTDELEALKALIDPRDLDSPLSRRAAADLRAWRKRTSFRYLKTQFFRELREGVNWYLSEKNRRRYTKRLYDWWSTQTAKVDLILEHVGGSQKQASRVAHRFALTRKGCSPL